MAGYGFKGATVTFGATTLDHVTGVNIPTTSSAVTQEVADSATALSLAGQASTTVTVNGVVKTTGQAAKLEALKAGQKGLLTIVSKDGIGGSTIVTWTSADSNSESQGVTFAGGAGQFWTYTVNFSTNGGTFS
jgi:hypothetical protein